jgi:hypothetical protein
MERIGLRLFSYLIGHTPCKELVELSRLAEDNAAERPSRLSARQGSRFKS